jgi:hypothetical protein
MILMSGVAGRDAVRDQLLDRDRFLDWRADHPGQVVVADQGRAGAVAGWVQVQHRAPAIRLTGLLDRSALYGVLAEIEALGPELLELRKLAPGP